MSRFELVLISRNGYALCIRCLRTANMALSRTWESLQRVRESIGVLRLAKEPVKGRSGSCSVCLEGFGGLEIG